MAMTTCYPSSYVQNTRPQIETYQPQQYNTKPRVPPPDYTIPLHVDCSVEYELPECAKPPQGVKVEPLLMIHPCHFRNLERQRRRPFENNLPLKNNNNVIQNSPKMRTNQHVIANNNYSCDFNVNSNNLNNNPFDYTSNNSARYNARTGVVRNHPYAPPCASRCPELPQYTLQHHPTLIYNV